MRLDAFTLLHQDAVEQAVNVSMVMLYDLSLVCRWVTMLRRQRYRSLRNGAILKVKSMVDMSIE